MTPMIIEDIEIEPYIVRLDDRKLKVGEFFSGLEKEIILHAGRWRVRTLSKSFYHAKDVYEFWVNSYIRKGDELVHKNCKLVSEEVYNKLLNSVRGAA